MNYERTEKVKENIDRYNEIKNVIKFWVVRWDGMGDYWKISKIKKNNQTKTVLNK